MSDAYRGRAIENNVSVRNSTVECLVYTQEVGGSNPFALTKLPTSPNGGLHLRKVPCEGSSPFVGSRRRVS